jgi:beta-fructofuranosidase
VEAFQMILNEQERKIHAAREVREQLLADRFRPGYHFAVPGDIGRPGDPNGAFYANGRYHLMYLYSRRGIAAYGNEGFCWGHVSSRDLVHWRHHPDAIVPGDGDFGCYSGGAFVDDDGTAYLSYWRLPRSDTDPAGQGIGIARSSDRHYDVWEKLETRGLDGSELGILELTDEDGNSRFVGNSDPSNIWKSGGTYYMEAGNLQVLDKLGRSRGSARAYRGDWVELYSSSDLVRWRYRHRFYQRDLTNRWTAEDEDDMCPSFLPLPRGPDGGQMSGKHLQLFIAHNRGCQYYIGTYDSQDNVFLPESHGRMSWADSTFFAPEALIDGRGRQIMWAWLTDNLRLETRDAVADGWCGVYGLPRVLWLGEDNTLRLAPAPELNLLRYNSMPFEDVTLDRGQLELSPVNGRSCEISVTINTRSAARSGVKVRTSADGAECTLLYYDAAAGELVFDASDAGAAAAEATFRRIEKAPFTLAAGELLRLRVFVDNSVVEIFANDRQAITRRVYPEREDSDRIWIFCDGGSATFTGIETWEMMESNPF